MTAVLDRKNSEARARDYCRSIGADPDELVFGCDHRLAGHGHRFSQPRWRWYVGAVIENRRGMGA